MDGQALTGRDLLAQFASDEFDEKITPVNSAPYVRDLIRRTSEFRVAKYALGSGAISERIVRQFVSDLVSSFQIGKRFKYEIALAAMAVLCETHYATFADELLLDLASLNLVEIRWAIKVAQICLKHRQQRTRNRQKVYVVKVDTLTTTEFGIASESKGDEDAHTQDEIYAFA